MPELILEGFTGQEAGVGGESHNERHMERPTGEGQQTWFSLAEVWLSAVSGHRFGWRLPQR